MGDVFKEMEPKKDKCFGDVYRADVQHCKTKKGFMYSIRLNLLVSKSCRGKCKREFCSSGWEEGDLGELDIRRPIIGIKNIVHGKLYRLETCNEYTDWETGYVEDYDIKIVEYQEQPLDSPDS